jgi:hypothetical protein
MRRNCIVIYGCFLLTFAFLHFFVGYIDEADYFSRPEIAYYFLREDEKPDAWQQLAALWKELVLLLLNGAVAFIYTRLGYHFIKRQLMQQRFSAIAFNTLVLVLLFAAVWLISALAKNLLPDTYYFYKRNLDDLREGMVGFTLFYIPLAFLFALLATPSRIATPSHPCP